MRAGFRRTRTNSRNGSRQSNSNLRFATSPTSVEDHNVIRGTMQSVKARPNRTPPAQRIREIAEQRSAEEHADRKQREGKRQERVTRRRRVGLRDPAGVEHADDQGIHQAEREDVDEDGKEERQAGAQTRRLHRTTPRSTPLHANVRMPWSRSRSQDKRVRLSAPRY